MKSFAILRTNVGLTTNIKIMVDSEYNLSLSSIQSISDLSLDRYQKVPFNKNNYYDELVPYFFEKTPTDTSFHIKYDNDVDKMSTDFKDQYDEIYQYGARNIISNKNYKEEFEYFAPLYIKKNNIPSNFVIFRVDGPGIGLLSKENFINEISNNFKIVKLFDLSLKTNLGQWIDKNFRNNKYFPETPLEMDFRELEFCKWNGIDIETGGYTSKSFFIDDFLEKEKEIFEFDKFIMDSYKYNKVAFPNILNFSFLFDDEPSTPEVKRKWSINRYYGFYLDSLEKIKTISPYINPFLRDDVTILEGNILQSSSNNDPFVNGFSDNKAFYVEYNGEYYKVQKYLETKKNQILSVPESSGLVVEQYVDVSIEKFRIISDLDLTDKQSYLNKNYGIIDSQNYLVDYDNNYITIEDFEKWSVWLIEINGIYHNLFLSDGKIKVNTDYSFNFNQNNYQYKLAGELTTVSFVVDNDNPPKKFSIYRANFTDIKDFDTRIVDTEYSKFEYEKEDEITITDETKMYVENLLTKTEPKELDDFVYKGDIVHIPVSSEYTAKYETFKLKNGELSGIWRKNPEYCRWSFQGSLSTNDYPYCLNNSTIFEDFNRTTNPFYPHPHRIERNLDYFYTINSYTYSYKHHSLHIEGYNDDGTIDVDFNFDLEKYLNIYTYSVGTNSFATYSNDYFSDFFYLKQRYSNNTIISNKKKFSIFNSGDKSIPNFTLFRGLKFYIYDIESIDINASGEINNINLSNNNTYDDYKFSILLSDNDLSVDFDGKLKNSSNLMQWEIIKEWKMDEVYATNSIVIFNDMLFQAQSENEITEPGKMESGLILKTAPYNSSDWSFIENSLQNPLGTMSIFWSPVNIYQNGDFVYNNGEFYEFDSSGTDDFWNPIDANTGYTIGDKVLFKGNYYESLYNTNKWAPDYRIPSLNFSLTSSSWTFKTRWFKISESESPKWRPIELWNPIASYNSNKLIFHNESIYISLSTTSVGDEPGVSNIWIKKYSLTPETDYVYNKNSNPIIEMNGVYYLCKSNVSQSTLDNGIVVYVNKKWKNILVNINISDNTLPNIKNTNRDDIYQELYQKITALNFTSCINDITNKYGFTDFISYVIINENGTITKHNYKNDIKNLSCLLKTEDPEELKVGVNSLTTKVLKSPTKLQSSRRLSNGNIRNINQLNWYSDLPISVEIEENKLEPKVTKNLHGQINIINHIFYRFNGYYMPTFYEIDLFDKTIDGISNNTKFDIDLTEFGIMKERKLSKVNRKGSVLKLRNESDSNSVYPMLDEFGYSIRDFFIFSSTWDPQYHWETMGPNEIPNFKIDTPTINSSIKDTFGQPIDYKNNNQNYNS